MPRRRSPASAAFLLLSALLVVAFGAGCDEAPRATPATTTSAASASASAPAVGSGKPLALTDRPLVLSGSANAPAEARSASATPPPAPAASAAAGGAAAGGAPAAAGSASAATDPAPATSSSADPEAKEPKKRKRRRKKRRKKREGSSLPSRNAVVKLLTPGEEPRREMRFVVPAGKTYQMTTTMRLNVTVKMKGKSAPAGQSPPIVMGLKLVTAKANEQGDIPYAFEVTKFDVASTKGIPPKMLAQMRGVFGKLKGVKGNAVVSSRGFTRSTKIDQTSALAGPQAAQLLQGIEQAMQQVAMPVPEEAIGKGAKWVIEQRIQQNGMNASQKTRYELTELDGNKLTAKIKVKQKAPKQKVRQMGMMVELLRMTAKGNGLSVVELDRLPPRRTSLSIKSVVKMKLPPPREGLLETTTQVSMEVR